jgi:hypothetical protein
VGAREVARRLRDEDLPAVADRSDASCAMDVDADVALLGEERLARVQAHPDADRSGLERNLSVDSRGKCIRGPREGDEERVSLRVDLDATVPAKTFTQRLSMVAKHIRVRIAELVQQPSRSLDVREEEGDCPGWKLAHTGMMRRLRRNV